VDRRANYARSAEYQQAMFQVGRYILHERGQNTKRTAAAVLLAVGIGGGIGGEGGGGVPRYIVNSD